MYFVRFVVSIIWLSLCLRTESGVENSIFWLLSASSTKKVWNNYFKESWNKSFWLKVSGERFEGWRMIEYPMNYQLNITNIISLARLRLNILFTIPNRHIDSVVFVFNFWYGENGSDFDQTIKILSEFIEWVFLIWVGGDQNWQQKQKLISVLTAIASEKESSAKPYK